MAKDLPYIMSRITYLEYGAGAQSMTIQSRQHAAIDILYWLKSDNRVKTDEEVRNKIERIQEELYPLSQQDRMYPLKKAQIYELKKFLED